MIGYNISSRFKNFHKITSILSQVIPINQNITPNINKTSDLFYKMKYKFYLIWTHYKVKDGLFNNKIYVIKNIYNLL